jgi:PAS domain S-box-containing protein
MWGYGDDKQVLGKHAATFWQHQDGPMQAIEVLHKTGGWIGELTAVKPDGSTFDAQVSASIVRGDNGDPICMMASFVDVSERKRAAESLRQSENKYRTLLENLPQRIFLKDNNSVYISCNANYARDLKIKPAEIAGKTDYDFYPKELAEKYKADDRRVVESGQTIDIEEKYILEGREFIVHTVKTPVADEQGNVIGMLGIFWDITDSKRRERELNLYREKMTQAERMASLGTLSASVAHELTQPLTTIRLSIENSLVDLEGTSCPPDALEELKDGIEGVEYAVSIIDRFRHFARQSSDEAITEVELKEVAERIVRLLDKNAQQADISLQLKDLERMPPIYANEKDMEQLFFAIVDNAIHAASGKEKRQLTISGVVKGEHIELRFADNCGGIAPENVDKIFEPFFTTRPAGEGTGLGLPIVRHIVSRVGGKVWVQNYPGKGATFLVNLPIGKDMGS